MFMVVVIWTLLVAPAIKDATSLGKNPGLLFVVRYAYIFVGAASTVFVNFVLNKLGNAS